MELQYQKAESIWIASPLYYVREWVFPANDPGFRAPSAGGGRSLFRGLLVKVVAVLWDEAKEFGIHSAILKAGFWFNGSLLTAVPCLLTTAARAGGCSHHEESLRLV